MLDKKITDSYIFKDGEPQYISRISKCGSRGILLNKKKQVALMYMKKRDMYKLPGGGIEEGETKEQAF
ncbi:MAG TPA: NUDIX hydrolase, partial [Clostridia bacterium]|nr:NUDIX hydrolase [Clostridia bacterium]